jgi:hypothetical protein
MILGDYSAKDDGFPELKLPVVLVCGFDDGSLSISVISCS